MFNYVISPDYITVLIWQQIMKRLIKRYVLKAQVDKENDEVNEGKKKDCLQYSETIFFMLYQEAVLQ